MPELDTASWYAFAIPAYVVYVAFEIALAHRRRVKTFGFAETISNLTAGLGTLIVGLFAGPWVLRAWDAVHDHVAPFRWPLHGAWKLPTAIVFADFCYYVYHRAGHRFALFWAIHGVHHQHEHLNSSVGYRLEWLADPYAALFFGLMPLFGVDSTTGFFAIAILSSYTLTAHSPLLSRRTFGVFITPQIHGSHHSRDERYFGKNFGAMLGIWDRIFDTWLEPPRGDVLHNDVASIWRTHDGVRAQWSLVTELWRSLSRVPTMREKMRILISPPAMVEAAPKHRADDDIPKSIRTYALASFLALAALGVWLLWFRGSRSFSVQIVIALTVLVGLHTTGGLLDGRARGVAQERARLVATAFVGVAFAGYSASVGGVGVALVVSALSFLAWTTSLGNEAAKRGSDVSPTR